MAATLRIREILDGKAGKGDVYVLLTAKHTPKPTKPTARQVIGALTDGKSKKSSSSTGTESAGTGSAGGTVQAADGSTAETV